MLLREYSNLFVEKHLITAFIFSVVIRTAFAYKTILNYPKSLYFIRETQQQIKKVDDPYFRYMVPDWLTYFLVNYII